MKEEKLLLPFFYKPMNKFGVRQLSREVHLDTKTILKYLKDFLRKGWVSKRKRKGAFAYYEANRLSLAYRFEKSRWLIQKLIETGGVGFLEKELKPKAIVLFGSVQKGTYHQKSDIDLFIQAPYQRINLSSFEKKVGHKIKLLFEPNLKNLNPGLLENLYNGEVLSGKLEVGA